VYCDTGGVFFQDKTVSLSGRKRPETNGRVSLLSPKQRMWDGQNAIHLRSDLDAVVRQLPSRNRPAGSAAMIAASAAILALFSLAILAAHALDAYRMH